MHLLNAPHAAITAPRPHRLFNIIDSYATFSFLRRRHDERIILFAICTPSRFSISPISRLSAAFLHFDHHFDFDFIALLTLLLLLLGGLMAIFQMTLAFRASYFFSARLIAGLL